MRMLVSSDADARYTPSVDHAISERPFEWPLKFLINSPVNGDHIFTRLSAAIQKGRKKNYLKRDECYQAAYEPQDASSVPSGLNLTADIDCVCPLSV